MLGSWSAASLEHSPCFHLCSVCVFVNEWSHFCSLCISLPCSLIRKNPIRQSCPWSLVPLRGVGSTYHTMCLFLILYGECGLFSGFINKEQKAWILCMIFLKKQQQNTVSHKFVQIWHCLENPLNYIRVMFSSHWSNPDLLCFCKAVYHMLQTKQ